MRPSCMCANCATTSGITTSCAGLALDPDCRCTELVRESYHPFFLRARNSLLQEKRGASRARSCAVGLPAGYSLISCGAVELSYLPETAPRRDKTQTKILQFEIHIVQICTTAREKVAPTTKAPKRKITSTLPASAKKRGVSENDRHATDGMNRLRLCHTIDEYRYIGRTGSQAKKERGFGWSEKLAALLSSQPPCPPCPAR